MSAQVYDKLGVPVHVGDLVLVLHNNRESAITTVTKLSCYYNYILASDGESYAKHEFVSLEPHKQLYPELLI